MNAITYQEYGGPEVLQITEQDIPTPKADEILIRVEACSITAADTFLRKGHPKLGRLMLGWKRPKKSGLGTGYAGVVVEVGAAVSQFHVNDEVFGETGLNFGAYAEYICLKPHQSVIHLKPSEVNFEQAATICDGVLTSYNFLYELAQIKAGDQILINGAAGALGVAAIQLAKLKKAHVTAVASTRNLAWLKELGADEVIDYTITNVTHHNNQFDWIYDCIGKLNFKDCKSILQPKGTYLSPVLSGQLLGDMMLTCFKRGQKAKFEATGMKDVAILNTYLNDITDLLRENLITIPITATYEMQDIGLAHALIDSGHKKGNIVLLPN